MNPPPIIEDLSNQSFAQQSTSLLVTTPTLLGNFEVASSLPIQKSQEERSARDKCRLYSLEYYETYEFLTRRTQSRTGQWLKDAFDRDSKSGTVRNDIAFLKTLADFLTIRPADEDEAKYNKHFLRLEPELAKRITDEDSSEDEERLQNLVKQFMAYIKQDLGLKLNTINSKFSLIVDYLLSLRIVRFDREALRKTVKHRGGAEQAEDIDVSKDDLRLIVKYASREQAARILAGVSSGFNPIDLASLRVKNVKFVDNIAVVSGRRAKNGQPFETHFSTEASTTSNLGK